jgi:hypothetical protein
MGLDQYAHIKAKGKSEPIEICYWRKHADLNEWMTQLALEKGVVKEAIDFNCVELELTMDDILKLEEIVKGDDLPHGEGFFWGQSFPEDKKTDLEFIEKAKEALAKKQEVIYTCWW